MTENRIFHLSNLAAGQEFDLSVAPGSDVLAAAQAHLEESGLAGDLQQGFYLSVYPRDPEGDAPASVQLTGSVQSTGTGQLSTDSTAADSGTIEEEAILA